MSSIVPVFREVLPSSSDSPAAHFVRNIPSAGYQKLFQNLRGVQKDEIEKKCAKIVSENFDEYETFLSDFQEKSAFFRKNFTEEFLSKMPFFALSALREGKITELQFGTIQLFWMEKSRSGTFINPQNILILDTQEMLEEALMESCHYFDSQANPKNLGHRSSLYSPGGEKVASRIHQKHTHSEIIEQLMKRISSIDESEKTIFLIEDQDNLSFMERRNELTISQRLNNEMGFNVFGRVVLKGKVYRMVPSFSFMQAYLDLVSGQKFTIFPVLGLSSPTAIAANVRKDCREIAVGFAPLDTFPELSNTADGFQAPDAEFSYHDFYHACALLAGPKGHRELFLYFADEVLLLKRQAIGSNKRELADKLQKLREASIDLELMDYSIEGMEQHARFFAILFGLIYRSKIADVESFFTSFFKRYLLKTEKSHFLEELLSKMLDSIPEDPTMLFYHFRDGPPLDGNISTVNDYSHQLIARVVENVFAGLGEEELLTILNRCSSFENKLIKSLLEYYMDEFVRRRDEYDEVSCKALSIALNNALKHNRVFTYLAKNYFFPSVLSVEDRFFEDEIPSQEEIQPIIERLKDFKEFGHLMEKLMLDKRDRILHFIIENIRDFSYTKPLKTGYSMVQYAAKTGREDLVEQYTKAADTVDFSEK